MERQYRNVLVLSGRQATLPTTGATLISVTGLAGYALATDKSFATVPLTCYVLGSAITTIPASLLTGAIGRRAGFQSGTALPLNLEPGSLDRDFRGWCEGFPAAAAVAAAVASA